MIGQRNKLFGALDAKREFPEKLKPKFISFSACNKNFKEEVKNLSSKRDKELYTFDQKQSDTDSESYKDFVNEIKNENGHYLERDATPTTLRTFIVEKKNETDDEKLEQVLNLQQKRGNEMYKFDKELISPYYSE